MNKLMQECWEILKKNPNLYTPPALLLILSGFVDPTEADLSSFFIVGVIAFVFINMAITAGWLNEIKVVIASKEQKATFDDVLVGIGKYFGVIVFGSLVFFLMGVALFSLHMMGANSLIGMNENHLAGFHKAWKTIQTLKQEDLQTYTSSLDPQLVAIAYKWAAALFLYVSIIGTFYFFISLWTQCCVFRGLNWVDGWKRSFKLVKNNLGIYTILTLIQTTFTLLFFFLTILLSDAFTQILLTIINIITKTYFTVLFCLFVVRFDDDKRIELLKDEVQSPLSEVQGPDNKK